MSSVWGAGVLPAHLWAFTPGWHAERPVNYPKGISTAVLKVLHTLRSEWNLVEEKTVYPTDHTDCMCLGAELGPD